MNYELERALRDKVDNWTFHALQNEVSKLQSENRQLQEELNKVQSTLRNRYEGLDKLITMMIDSELFPDTDLLFSIKQYL